MKKVLVFIEDHLVTLIIIALFIVLFILLVNCQPEGYSPPQEESTNTTVDTDDDITVTAIELVNRTKIYRIVDHKYGVVCFVDYDAEMWCTSEVSVAE